MRVADSSFLITLIDEDDPRHPEAFRLGQDPEPILVPGEVISETLGVMHVRYGYEMAKAIWANTGEMANLVHLNTTHQEDVAPIFLEGEGRLSWTDAAVVAHCLREDAEPLCYDEDIVAAWRSRLDPSAPA